MLYSDYHIVIDSGNARGTITVYREGQKINPPHDEGRMFVWSLIDRHDYHFNVCFKNGKSVTFNGRSTLEVL